MDAHNPQHSAFPPGGGERDLFPVGAGVNSVLPTGGGEGAAARAESERGTFSPGAGKNSAFPAGAEANSVLPTGVGERVPFPPGAGVNSAVRSASEQIEVRIGRGSSPRPAVVLGGPTRIITPLMGTTPALLSAEIEALATQAVDLVEWRVDPLLAALEPASDRRAAIEEAWEAAVSQAPLPVLATIRTTAEGGAAELSASEYAELVALLAGLADAVDVEIARAESCALILRAHQAGAAVIASFHDFNETPPDDTLAALYSQMAESGADVLKVACRVTTPEDALRVLAAQIGAHREHCRPIIGIGMGEAGAITRIAGSPLFSAATFASVGVSSAPGQFTVEETRRGLDLVEKGRTVERGKAGEKGKTAEGEKTADKARGR